VWVLAMKYVRASIDPIEVTMLVPPNLPLVLCDLYVFLIAKTLHWIGPNRQLVLLPSSLQNSC
jgi:hypothetical protein